MSDWQAYAVALEALRTMRESDGNAFEFALAEDLIGLPSIFPFDVANNETGERDIWLAGVQQYASVHVQRLFQEKRGRQVRARRDSFGIGA